MTTLKCKPLLPALMLLLALVMQAPAQLPVSNAHPRIFLDSTTKALMLVKKNNLDPDWTALKAEADNYATLPVLSWTPANATVWNTNYIFYNYCGSSWDDATMSLGMAHQLTKGNTSGAFPTQYSNKMMEIADSILSAYARYPPCSGCNNIFQWNSSYATRHVGNVIGTIFDWCYDELGSTRKTAMINLMNNWYDYMRVPFNTYQNNVHPSGNYYFGHALCAAFMGYSSMHDNPRAQEMIDFARQRVLGTQSGSLNAADLTTFWLKHTYLGGLPSSASSSYLGPAGYTSAPHKDGLHVQGWGYGGETLKRLCNYCIMVQSATGESVTDSLMPYLSKVSEAFVHALTPNRFQVDNSNDWGSFRGNLMSYGEPLLLAATLEGSTQGPYAEYFYRNWITRPSLTHAWNDGYPELKWEKLLFADTTRPATAFDYKPYYPVPATNVFSSVMVNEALPKYYMRENWSDTATWCALNMSCAYYDDHDHHNAGHFQIVRGDNHDGDDLLLVGANEVGNDGAFGLNGLEGGTCYHFSSSLSNTLFFDDYHDYVQVNNSGHTVGGQSFYGYDEVTNQEQADSFSYVRADLTSAYHRKGDLADTVNRTLLAFHRSFLYLRNPDVVLCYDNILAKNSTNPSGQYLKHLRWHFLEQPQAAGNNLTAAKDNSKLFVHTVIPDSVSINLVNESSNPDNTFGASLNYAFNTYSWRAEVSVPGNPLKQDLLTVFQPGATNAAEMTTQALHTVNDNMEGSLITLGNAQEIVFFNRDSAKYPTPVNNTSYAFSWHPNTMHTLCGVTPNLNYDVQYDGTTITVSPSPTGNVTASPSGVLRYRVSLPVGITPPAGTHPFLARIYPNPSRGSFTCSWDENETNIDRIEVRNVCGQLVTVKQAGPATHSLQTEVDAAGVYFVSFMKGEEKLATQRLVIAQ